MSSNQTYSKHPLPTYGSPVMGMFHGMQCGSIGDAHEAIQNRLGLGKEPKEAGR